MANPAHLGELDRAQATMGRSGGSKAHPPADHKEATLIALSFKQMDVECREGLHGYAPLLHTVKLVGGKFNSRHIGLPKPDYSEKSKGRLTFGASRSSAEVKVGVTAASGLQVKTPSKTPKSVGSLEVFNDSAVGALPAIWALPQSLVLEGEKKGWRKIMQRIKCFLLKTEPKKRIAETKKRTSQKMIGFDHLINDT